LTDDEKICCDSLMLPVEQTGNQRLVYVQELFWSTCLVFSLARLFKLPDF